MDRLQLYADNIKRALLAMGIAVTGAVVFYGDSFSSTVPIFNIMIPSPVLIGAATAGASLVTDMVYAFVMPHVSGSKFMALEHAAIAMGVSGAAAVGALKLMGAEGGFEWEIFTLGAVSYMGADYIGPKLGLFV